MRWYRFAALAALVAAAATPALAQERQAPAPRRGPLSVETALRMREQLKLNESQVTQLEAMRKEMVAQRQNQAREMIDLESRAAAGLIDREEVRKQMESRRESMRTTMEQRRDRFEKLLTDEQRAQMRTHMNARRVEMRRPGRGAGVAPRAFDRRPRRPPMPGRYYWF